MRARCSKELLNTWVRFDRCYRVDNWFPPDCNELSIKCMIIPSNLIALTVVPDN